MKQVTLQEQIDSVMDWMDFRYIAECIWRDNEKDQRFFSKGSPDGPVDAVQHLESLLRKRARKAMLDGWEYWKRSKDFQKEQYYSLQVYHCGGFRVFASQDGNLEVAFCLESWSYSEEDGEEIEYVD